MSTGECFLPEYSAASTHSLRCIRFNLAGVFETTLVSWVSIADRILSNDIAVSKPMVSASGCAFQLAVCKVSAQDSTCGFVPERERQTANRGAEGPLETNIEARCWRNSQKYLPENGDIKAHGLSSVLPPATPLFIVPQIIPRLKAHTYCNLTIQQIPPCRNSCFPHQPICVLTHSLRLL